MFYRTGSDMDPVTGKFSDGNSGTGQPASFDHAADMNQVYDEIINVITNSGETPTYGSLQLYSAIQAILASTTRSPNHFVDPCCRVAQGLVPNLSTSKQYGAVDMVQAWVSSGSVSAGTIGQDITGAIGALTPFSVHLAGVSLGANSAISYRRWLESIDAQDYINGPCIVAVSLFQTTGNDIPNVTITLNKANAANNFGATTLISASGNLDVPNNTLKRVYFYVPNMGLCQNGIEMITTMPTGAGAVVTKDFYITDFQISPASVLAPFEVPKFGVDLANVSLRYLERSYEYGTATGTSTQNGAFGFWLATAVANGNGIQSYMLRGNKVVTPAVTIYSKVGTSGKISVTNVDTAVSTTPYMDAFGLTNSSGGTIGDGTAIYFHYVADARL